MDYAPRKQLEIPRIPSATPEELEANYIGRGLPVILTDMIADWPAMSKWTLPYMREMAGDVSVPVRGNRYNFRLFGTVPLANYIDWLLEERADPLLDPHRAAAPYISHNRSMTSRLEPDTDFRRFVPPGYRVGKPAFWIGPPEAETPLHYDAVGIVFFAQIVGRKRVILFTSDQSKLLYESSYFDFTTCYSRVDLRDVDYDRFPRFADAVPYMTVLQPGEVLVFPRLLWHEFRTLDNSVSVTAHAGTERDYSHRRNPMLARERARQALHWFGLHARGRCSCHSNPDDEQWQACMESVSNAMAEPAWIAGSPPLHYLANRISHTMLHGRSLGEILEWRRSTHP
ncbi:cupin-like domain-containing protein [Nannocystaceae bacterium ST9]